VRIVGLYRDEGLSIYEKAHYARGEHLAEVEEILRWYGGRGTRVLDVGCSGGLHALEFARRGFRVVGIDVEPSAILLAEARARSLGLPAEFHTLDVAEDDLSRLGGFQLIYSIGNVLSHVRRDRLPAVLAGLRRRLASAGALVLDVLAIADPFPREVREESLGIVWKRQLDPMTGRIVLEGSFLDFGVEERFDVWGYRSQEVLAMLSQAGFHGGEVSQTLDFSSSPAEGQPSVCLYFRAFSEEAP
jgi:SAM-dependent methyltransferase